MPQAGIQLPKNCGRSGWPWAARDVLHVERAVDHHDAHDGRPDGDLRGDHQGGRPLPAEQRVVVGRGPARHHEPVDAQRQHGEHVEDAHVERHRLQLDRAPRDGQGVAEGDGGEGREREEDRHERRQHEEQPVRVGGHEVFLRQHLDRVREGMEQPQARMPKMEARLAPMRSCMIADCLRSTQVRMPAQVQHHEHREGDGAEAREEVAAPPLMTRPPVRHRRGRGSSCRRYAGTAPASALEHLVGARGGEHRVGQRRAPTASPERISQSGRASPSGIERGRGSAGRAPRNW